MPLLLLVTTIPVTTQGWRCCTTEVTVVLLFVQFPVVVNVVGSVKGVLVFPLLGRPPASCR